MKIKTANNSDRDDWDRYVLSHPDGLAYHLFGWKLAVEAAYGFKGMYLLATDGGSIVGILPLIVFTGIKGKTSIISLPYCDVAGPLADSNEIADKLLKFACALAIEKKQSCQIRRSLCSPGHFDKPVEKVRMILELPASSTQLMSGFKSKLRSQIRKPFRDGLSVSIGSDRLINDFYCVFSENMRDLGSPVHSRRWIDSIVEHYAENVRVAVVYSPDGIPAAAGIILLHSKTISVPWASSLMGFNRLNPNMMLYWTFLEFASDNGYAFFDFGRSTPGEGTFKFKQQWGAIPKPLSWWSHPTEKHDQALIGGTSVTRTIVSGLWSKLPVSCANVVGPFIRRKISL